MEEFYVCPHCNKKVYGNKKVFANHVRWCKKNPRYEDIRKSTIEKISGEKVERKEHKCMCEICGKEYTVRITDAYWIRGKYPHTCSKKCAKALTSLKTDKESKNKKIGDTLRKERYIKKCKCCGCEFETANVKQTFCSRKCQLTYRHRESVSINDTFITYKKQCMFKFSLNQFPYEYDFALIENNGWYKAKNHGDNMDGVNRDHMFSIVEGYKNKIDPYIISHPANCELLTHFDNVSKNSKCSVTIDDLKQRIKEWHSKYGVYSNNIDYYGIEEFNTEIMGV